MTPALLLVSVFFAGYLAGKVHAHVQQGDWLEWLVAGWWP